MILGTGFPTAMEAERVGGWFEQAGAENGVLGPHAAASFLRHSGLPKATLSRIWRLGDLRGTGQFDETAFLRYDSIESSMNHLCIALRPSN